MIDPFTALLGVLLAVALLGLGISLLNPWREDRGHCAEMLRVRSTVTSAIKSGLDVPGRFPEPDENAPRPIAPIDAPERSTECSSSEQS